MSDLTGRQRMVLDYMRGNGCVLTTAGYEHLCKRGSFNSRGLSQVMAVLRRDGYLEQIPPPYKRVNGVATLATLTKQGRRS